MIVDLSNFTEALRTRTNPKILKEWFTYAEDAFDIYLDWVVAHILVTEYKMRVIGYHRKDGDYINVFEEDEAYLKISFKAVVGPEVPKAFAGQPVKLLVTGPDLYIALRNLRQ